MASLNVYIVTFNCAQKLINADLFASHLFDGLGTSTLPDIIAISLQEIAPIPLSLIGGSFVAPYFARFELAVRAAVKHHGGVHTGYNVVSQKAVGMVSELPASNVPLGDTCVGTFFIVLGETAHTAIYSHSLLRRSCFKKQPTDPMYLQTGIIVFAKDISAIENIETAGVGVGMWAMGYKGAAASRISYREGDDKSIDLTFVSAHLAAFEAEVPRRNEDWKNIVRGLVFSSTKHTAGDTHHTLQSDDERPLLSISPADASIYKPTSHLFLAGDLNYRTSTMKPAPDDYLKTFPQPNQPISSPQHWSKLFENDQLTRERAAGRTCHGLSEAVVSFGPTYKFEPHEAYAASDEELSHWPWAKHRWPSWCDRCLYLEAPQWLKRQHPGADIVVHKYSSLPLMPTSDHRPVALSISVPLLPIPKPDLEELEDDTDPRIQPPFNIDPDWKLKRERARKLEIVVGLGLYFTNTRAGLAISVTSLAILTGLYLILRAFS